MSRGFFPSLPDLLFHFARSEVAFLVIGVFLGRTVFQVFNVVIERIPVEMPDLKPARTWANKSSRHEPMDPDRSPSLRAVLFDGNSPVRGVTVPFTRNPNPPQMPWDVLPVEWAGGVQYPNASVAPCAVPGVFWNQSEFDARNDRQPPSVSNDNLTVTFAITPVFTKSGATTGLAFSHRVTIAVEIELVKQLRSIALAARSKYAGFSHDRISSSVVVRTAGVLMHFSRLLLKLIREAESSEFPLLSFVGPFRGFPHIVWVESDLIARQTHARQDTPLRKFRDLAPRQSENSGNFGIGD